MSEALVIVWTVLFILIAICEVVTVVLLFFLTGLAAFKKPSSKEEEDENEIWWTKPGADGEPGELGSLRVPANQLESVLKNIAKKMPKQTPTDIPAGDKGNPGGYI